MFTIIKNIYNKNYYLNYLNPIKYFLILLIDIFYFVNQLLKSLKYSYLLSETRRLKNVYKNSNAIVIANGPSLNKVNLEKVKKLQSDNKFKIFCVNSFIGKLHETLIPDYYVLSDPVYFGIDEGLHSQVVIEEVQQDLFLISKYQIPVFIPFKYKKKFQLETKVFYFNDNELRRLNKNVTNIIKPRSYKSITAYKALAISCFMGFKNIFIIGYDNDYFKTIKVDKWNQISILERHAFKQGDSDRHQINKELSLGQLLLIFSYSFSDLDRFPKNIYNLDQKSLIDSFKKIKIDDIRN